jgi:hypothetical protein
MVTQAMAKTTLAALISIAEPDPVCESPKCTVIVYQPYVNNFRHLCSEPIQELVIDAMYSEIAVVIPPWCPPDDNTVAA